MKPAGYSGYIRFKIERRIPNAMLESQKKRASTRRPVPACSGLFKKNADVN
jgi:hypothetical protein